jgi:hypothetical protein
MVFRFSFDSLTETLLLRVSVFYNSVSLIIILLYPVILILKLSLVQFHSSKQWTSGRVVEGARLERVYRETYLGFEPLGVRHTSFKVFIYFNFTLFTLHNKSYTLTIMSRNNCLKNILFSVI